MNKLKNYFYYYLTRLWSIYWNRCASKSRINGLILMFHNVSDTPIDIDESCQHTVAEFEAPLIRLAEEEYRFVDISEALRIIDGKSTDKFATVTFDDCFDSVYTNAYPFLKRFKIPFTCFITTSFIGKPGYLNKYQIKELDNDPLCTIGAHTVSHPMLCRVKNSREEIRESKEILEKLLGHPVHYFAYPFGQPSSVSSKTIRLAREAGFDAAFGTIPAPVSDISAKSRFYLPRIVLKK